MVDFDRHGLGLSDLADFIRLGNEIEVTDEQGQNLTKQTLVDIAFATSGLADSAGTRGALMQLDEFRLHQLIEDEQVAEFLGR